MHAISPTTHFSGARIDREFSNPNVTFALQSGDEDILADAEILDALMYAKVSGETTRPANEFFAELRKELD